MTSNEIIAHSVGKMRDIVAELRHLAARCIACAEVLKAQADNLEPPPATPETDRSSHRS